MLKKKFKEWLLKREVDKWLDENPTLLQDVVNLVDGCTLFEIKYGIPVRLHLEKMQEYTNKRFRNAKITHTTGEK